MSIRPIDLQQMIPKSQEMANNRVQEAQKLAGDQNHLNSKFNDQIKNNSQQIVKSKEGNKSEYKYDAREKGNGSYEGNKGKKKKAEKKEEQNNNKDTFQSTGKFDMKI